MNKPKPRSRTERPRSSAVLAIGAAAVLAAVVVAIRGRSRSTVPAGAVPFEQSVEIAHPPEEIFAFVADPRNDLAWEPRVIEEVHQTSEGPLSVGTMFLQAGHFLGLRFEIPIEVTRYEPNRRFSFEAAMGPLRFTGSRIVEGVAGGTRLTLTVDGYSGGSSGIADPIFARLAARQLETELAKLKVLLEARKKLP